MLPLTALLQLSLVSSLRVMARHLASLLPVVVVLLGGAVAAPRSLLSTPGGPSEAGLYLAPVHYNHTLDGPAFSAPSSWYLAQWSGTQQLNASNAVAGDGPCAAYGGAVWHARAAGLLVCMQARTPGGRHELLVAQNGSAAALPCGAEYDGFLAPTDKAYDNAPQNINSSTPVSAMRDLVASFDIELVEAATWPRCGPVGSCGPSGHLDYGYVVLGVVLSSLSETIFYQAILYDTRAPPSCGAQDPCRPFLDWFGTTEPYGVSESIANSFTPAQGSCLQPGVPQSMALPLAARLLYAIAYANATYGTRGDPALWHITGIYLGAGLEGSAMITLRSSGLDLVFDDDAAGQ